MVDDWGRCPECGKPRQSDETFAWCGAIAQWVHSECAREHQRRRPFDDGEGRLLRSGQHWTCCGYHELDHPLPTEYDGDGWIQVEGATWSQRSRWTGKWLLFWPPSAADDAWDTIRWATLGDAPGLGQIDPPELQLGYAAKVADRTNLSRRDGSHSCCVYTGDCRDLDDVQRVLVALRDLGFDQKLLYKDDAATERFIYGRDGVFYVAAAGSTDLEQIRDPIEPLEPGAAVTPGSLR